MSDQRVEAAKAFLGWPGQIQYTERWEEHVRNLLTYAQELEEDVRRSYNDAIRDARRAVRESFDHIDADQRLVELRKGPGLIPIRFYAEAEQRGYNAAIEAAQETCVEAASRWGKAKPPVSGHYSDAARVIEDEIAALWGCYITISGEAKEAKHD